MRPNGVIIRYTLHIGHENGAVEVYTADGQSTSYNVTNLLPYELISVRVTASTRIGEGPAATDEVRTAQARMCMHEIELEHSFTSQSIKYVLVHEQSTS